MRIVFWASVALVVYTYLLYPAVLYGLRSVRGIRMKGESAGRRDKRVGSEKVDVSIVIAVHNEERVLEERLRNLSTLVYHGGALEILIGSDGSTDRTEEILRSAGDRRIEPVIFGERRGKASILNDLVPRTRGEIVVFSDANTMFLPDTVEKLVGGFSDDRTGIVAGELVLESDKANTGGTGEVAYWDYESRLKALESDVRTTVAPAGGIYALRKSLFRPLPADRVVMDDFLIAMGVLREGFNVKYEPSARAVEQSAGSIEGEFRRKIRIGAANFSGISEFADLLRPGAGIVAFMLWSHKILRWCVPFLLIAASAAAMALATGSEFFGIVRLVIAGCLLLGAAGFIADRAGIRIGIFGYPYYFLVVNAALLAGFFRFLGGTQKSTWEVVR